MLAAENRLDSLSLLRGRVLVDVQCSDTISFMYGLRPPETLGENYTIKLGIAELSLLHLVGHKCFAAAMCGKRVKVARASPVTITALDIFRINIPLCLDNQREIRISHTIIWI